MQKGGFCVAKTTLLPRKNRVFQMPNNELCKALIQKQLHRGYIYENICTSLNILISLKQNVEKPFAINGYPLLGIL